ncbi:MAG: hypothetical protein ACE5KH_01795 [Candidatus Geothermarchaeales archaeon]
MKNESGGLIRVLRSDLLYLKPDLKHLLLNLPLSLVGILFYVRFGFEVYGWLHLGLLVSWSLYTYTLDDWIDGKRPFPRYVLPLLAYAAVSYPLYLVLHLAGEVLINLRSILATENVVAEKLEAVGDWLIYIPIYFFPLGVDAQFLLGCFVVCFALDQTHKYGHSETAHPTLTLILAIAPFTYIAIQNLLMHPVGSEELTFLLGAAVVGAIPFFVSEGRSRRYWFQIWQGYVVPLSVFYTLYYPLAYLSI